jgi:hypothetical protein
MPDRIDNSNLGRRAMIAAALGRRIALGRARA